jgi:hypothetical protein
LTLGVNGIMQIIPPSADKYKRRLTGAFLVF